MATVLLLVIYIAFIGLGIPDSLLGAAWPAIYPEFGVPMASASCITMIVSGGTILSSLSSSRVIGRFGTGRVTAVSTLVTAAALGGFSAAPGMAWMCLLAIPLGLGAGAIDTALNNYVALHYKAVHMNFLHCFYGIGVSVSPWLMSLALAQQSDWHRGYRSAFFVQAGISALCLLALPLWSKVKFRLAERGVPEEKIRTLTLREMLGMPRVRAAGLAFFGSCAIECTCGTWGSTYLVNARGLTAADAAGIITFYYVGIAGGRFLAGLAANRLSSRQLIRLGQCVLLAAIVILLFPLPALFSCIGVFLIGLGNGPLFPNLIHLTPENFGKDVSQSVVGFQMAVSSVSILMMPPLFGVLAQTIDVRLFPWFLLAMYGILLAATRFLFRTKRQPSAAVTDSNIRRPRE